MASDTRDELGRVGPPASSPTRTGPFVTRFLMRWLWSSEPHDTMAETVAFQRRSYDRSTVIVRAYYAVSVLWAVQAINAWPRYSRLAEAQPLWPARWWFDAFDVRTGVNIIFCGYVAASLVVLLVPERRWARVAYAFMLLQYMAFVNGFDKINHDLHAWLFVSVVLILLPRGPWGAKLRVADRQLFLTVIWTAQLVVLFFYSLTGIWKIATAVVALAAGRVSGFHFSGFSYIVSDRLLQTSQDTVLGSFFTHNELPGWALFLGTMYLETFSVLIAFRPRLHRIWGVALVLFHIGTQLAMGFTFPGNVVLVGLLLVCSPLAPERINVKDALLDLPGIHFLAGRVRHRAAPSRPTPSPQTL